MGHWSVVFSILMRAWVDVDGRHAEPRDAVEKLVMGLDCDPVRVLESEITVRLDLGLRPEFVADPSDPD
ncbi:MAG TPA: hypothetical protein VNN79_14910, partial [Actinomycetota bacterium]|nr:hypothetical protein [Actinomycetota bacterium]